MINYDHRKAIISVAKSTMRGSIRKTLLATDSGYKIKIQYYESYPFTSEWVEVTDVQEAISDLVRWTDRTIWIHRGCESQFHSLLDELRNSQLLHITGCYTCGL